ncbi:Substrate-specific component BioY of biotin ECF transporter [Micrococcus lylae]|uniref:Biotin transporter n=2 Tax=Micrococcus lylae TaxID=1273 RepID=A0A1R4JGA8_9MICC|nr:ECF transporter S component [Micrococcus lylae]SJN31037.1 Substrate-specific component BioY of biotin ECF transporter [Micrococcus lylae]
MASTVTSPAPTDAPRTQRPASPTSPTSRSAGPQLARIAVMTALIAVLGVMPGIPVPGIAVPITLQTLGVMLAGLVLGPWAGAASVLLLHALVAMGLPLLAGGKGGLGVFAGPTVGYLIGWVFGAFVVGLVFRALRGRTDRTGRLALAAAVASVLGGIVVIYAFGIPGVSLITGVPLDAAALGNVAFLPGDALKAALATLLVVGLAKAYPRALR